jgi:segregation and condensation protein B
MLGTTREFLDYFGLKRLDDLPPLAEIRELGPGSDPQSDFVDELSAMMRESEVSVEVAEDQAVEAEAEAEAEEASQNVVSIQQSEG